MKGEHTKLEEQIQTLNGELRMVREQNEHALQVAHTEKQILEETHSKLGDKYREKEADLEEALTHKSDLEDQLQKSRANHEQDISHLREQLQQLQSESTELWQQVARAYEETAVWKDDYQAKTQVKLQYSKQVEQQFRVEVDGLTAELKGNRAKIAMYEQHHQEQVRQLDENEEQKVRLIRTGVILYPITTLLLCALKSI